MENDLFADLLDKDLGLDSCVCNIQQPADFIHKSGDLDRPASVFEDIVHKFMEKLACVEVVGALEEDHLVEDQH